MRSIFLILILVFISKSLVCAKDSDTVIQTNTGALKGTIKDGVATFYGIPYTSPPVGLLRWSAPQALAPWEGVFDARKFGNVCPQYVKSSSIWKEHIDSVGMSEDCLTLNIWSSINEDKKLKPVMMYIHGGTMKRGSGSFGVYSGKHLAKEGVVVVTINYRVGNLGRFAHPSMTKALGRKPLVNYGLLDQVAALKWIQTNISNFGGDPDNVTIFGHSAGGASVNHLMIMPQSKGLFHKAIAQGSAVSISTGQHAFKRGSSAFTTRSVEDIGVEFAEYFDIEEKTDSIILEKMRAIPWQKIIEYQREIGMVQFMPVVDGVVVVDSVSRVFEQGKQHNVPYLAGANSWEWSQISRMPFIAKWFMANAMLDGLSDEDLAPFDDKWTRVGVLHRWFAEGMFLTSTRYLAKKMSTVPSPAWHYHITYIQENIRGDVPGAAHGMETAYIFNTARQNPQWLRPRAARDEKITQEDLAWGDTIRSYWLNFARKGDPNGEGLPKWPKYDSDADITMELGVEMRAVKGLNAKTLDHLEKRALIRRQVSVETSKKD